MEDAMLDGAEIPLIPHQMPLNMRNRSEVAGYVERNNVIIRYNVLFVLPPLQDPCHPMDKNLRCGEGGAGKRSPLQWLIVICLSRRPIISNPRLWNQ